MNGQRLPEQLQLVFASTEEGPPSPVVRKDAEPVMAKYESERPAVTNSLMEAICERENLKRALRRVKANKGSPGVDGMTVEQLPNYLRAHWPTHRDELVRGTYTPSPVRRVEIPKPNGGTRKLGVPTALAFLPYDDTNALTLELVPTIVERAGATPVIAGLGAHDPRRSLERLVDAAATAGDKETR